MTVDTGDMKMTTLLAQRPGGDASVDCRADQQPLVAKQVDCALVRAILDPNVQLIILV